MLNEACPNMIGFYSDMVEDFKLIDEMNYGDKAQWFYRKQGTCFEVERSSDVPAEFRLLGEPDISLF